MGGVRSGPRPAGGCGRRASADGRDSWTGGEVDEEVVEALQAELRVVPGVDGAEADYANDWKIQGRLSVAVTVEPGTDLDRITAQSERLAWQSAAVIEVVDVTVRWPRDLEGTPERSQSRHAADCAALLDARDCRPLTVLRDRYGSRPD